ncbi:ribonuclease H2 subunit C-like [Haemaphysalis longicornis]
MAAAAELKTGSAKNVDVHFFPCDIEHRGAAKMTTYFSPHVETVEGQPEVLKSQFRGRPLKGRELALPDGYAGIVARTSPTDSVTKSLYVSGKFDKITAWNWGLPPSEEKCRKINDWITVSRALHGQSDD